jgi:membrane associated rhomboid family serine protease
MAVSLLLALLGVIAYRMTTAAQRAQYVGYAVDLAGELKAAATQPRPEAGAFRDLLRARMPRLAVTPAIVAINVAVAACMLIGPTASGNPDTLLGWGASVGPLTTNGQWWRLVTASFVHIGVLHLLVNVAVLCQLGAVLERLAGRLAFAAAYISAGAFAGLISLSSEPVAVSVSASGAVCGLYGLLLASLIWQRFQPQNDAGTGAIMPLTAMKRLGYGAALFSVCTVANGCAGPGEAGGLVVGLAYGLALGWCFVHRQPATGHVAAAIAVSAAIAVGCAVPLRNIADVKPEIARAIATEERTAAAYQSALHSFSKGEITAETLAQLAERTIVPELQVVGARLEALRRVPPEYQSLVSDAREFVRLRCRSWRLRADAIRRTDAAPHRAKDGTADAGWRLQAEARFRSNLIARGNAEGAERASLDMFQRIKR